MGVVVRRYIDLLIILLIPTPLVLRSFFCTTIPTTFIHVYVIFVQYSKRCSKNIRDGSKIEIMRTC